MCICVPLKFFFLTYMANIRQGKMNKGKKGTNKLCQALSQSIQPLLQKICTFLVDNKDKLIFKISCTFVIIISEQFWQMFQIHATFSWNISLPSDLCSLKRSLPINFKTCKDLTYGVYWCYFFLWWFWVTITTWP